MIMIDWGFLLLCKSAYSKLHQVDDDNVETTRQLRRDESKPIWK